MIGKFRVVAALAAGLSLASVVGAVAPAAADDYPSRPITMIIPLAPGGSTDVLARIMAEGMRKSLGQPVIPENTSGAGGTIGVTKAERSAPDGYTILFGQFGTNMANGRSSGARILPPARPDTKKMATSTIRTSMMASMM